MRTSSSLKASFRSLSSRRHNDNRENNGGKVKGNELDDMCLSLSRRPSFGKAQMSFSNREREVKIKDIVGCGIAGILHKWVNYGRGWQSRWFVLQDGVLSYYKTHGSSKMVLDQERDGSVKVIGEDSKRRVARDRSRTNSFPRKPIGEIHLKVGLYPSLSLSCIGFGKFIFYV